MASDKLLAEWFWTDRWMGSSGFLLPIAPRGLYREMLTQAWRRGARLPNDPRAIQRACGVTPEEWEECWPAVKGYWVEEDGFLVNLTQQQVYNETVELHERAVVRAKAAANARWNAQAMLKHKHKDMLEECPPSPSPSPSLTQTPSKRSVPSERFVAGHPAYDVAAYLLEAIRSHSPNAAVCKNGRGVLKKWAKDIDLAIRRDDRSEDDLRAVIDWAHADDPRGFWRPNLMSGAKLRKHFDTIMLQRHKRRGLLDDLTLPGGDPE